MWRLLLSIYDSLELLLFLCVPFLLVLPSVKPALELLELGVGRVKSPDHRQNYSAIDDVT